MNAGELDNLSSGLIGALIGSLLGFVGSTFLDWRHDRRARRSAARALLVEISSNYRGTHELSADLRNEVPSHWPDFDSTRYYAKQVWLETLAHVSPMLNWNELEKISTAYRLMEAALQEIRRAGDGVQKSSPTDRWSNFRSDLQHIEAHSLGAALHAFNDATTLLSAKVLRQRKGEQLARITR